MSLGERLIKNNEYDKGYAQAIEDAAKLFTCWQPSSAKLCQCPSCTYKQAIKALLPKGTK